MSVVLPVWATIRSPSSVEAIQPIPARSPSIPVGTVPVCIVETASLETTARPSNAPAVELGDQEAADVLGAGRDEAGRREVDPVEGGVGVGQAEPQPVGVG